MFRCNQCGDCCRVPIEYDFINVVLTNKDIDDISKGLDITAQNFADKYCVLKEIYLDTTHEKFFLKAHLGSCIFLKNNKCIIHEYKPLQCKLAPLLFNTKTDLWQYLKCNESLPDEIFDENDILFFQELLHTYDF